MQNKVEKLEYTFVDGVDVYTFVFFPQESSCHSFGDEPPTGWNDVYKVYFQYEITRDCLNLDEEEVVWKSYCDENSIMKDIAWLFSAISNNNSDAFKYLGRDYHALGGVSWRIDDIPSKVNCYRITMLNGANEKFELYRNSLELGYFADFLDRCCKYMLTHGDPM